MRPIVATRGEDTLMARKSIAEMMQQVTWSDGFWAFLFLIPTFLGLAIVLTSVVGGFAISLTQWDILTPPKWIGAGNYLKMLNDDERFRQTLLNTLYFTLGVVPLGTALSLVAAVVMNQGLKAQTLFRTTYFLPTVSSGIAIALLWGWLYNAQYGLINYLLGLVGIPKVSWLGDTRFAMPAIIIMTIWRGLGYNMVLFLAGLQGIPPEFYEAATIDGASRWRRFRHITLPLLSPTTFFVIVLSMIGSFQVFEATYVMTQGGPFFSTYTMVLYIFFEGFQWFRMGYASALAYVLFAMILTVTLVQLRLEKRMVHYD
jgi:multiple sugar transport system permease protein